MADVRRVTDPADLPSVLALERACFPAPWSEENLADSFVNPFAEIWKAEEDGGLCAYAVIQIAAGEDGELLRIGVAPPRRERGIGGALLRTILACHPQVKIWRLDVRSGNAAAAALYASCGFSTVARNKDFYENPKEDGCLMAVCPKTEKE